MPASIVGSNVRVQAEIKEMKAAFDLIDYDGLGPVEVREGFR